MPGKDLNYRITVDQAAGSSGIRDFSRTVTSELRRVDTALEDTGTASQRAANLLNTMADEAATELAAAVRAADALGTAMGPELAAKLGRNGVAQAVGDLSRMGVTFDEITADADQLAAAIRNVDEVQTSAIEQGLGNVSGKLREAGHEADQSRSVLANMAGNSAQSLGELGGVVGDLGVGIGQLAEYATEGNIGLRGLAQVAGPMAMLTLATQAFSAVMEGIKFSETFRTEAIKDWTEALESGETVLSHIGDMARTAKLEVDMAGGSFAGLGRHAEDVTGSLQTLNMTTDDFARLVAKGSPELAKLRAEYGRLVNLGPQATDQQDEIATAMSKVIGAAEQQRDAIASANDEMARVAEVTKPSTEAVRDALDAWSALKDPVSTMPAEFDRVAAAMRDGVTPAAADVDAIMDQTGMTMGEVFDQADNLNSKLAEQKSKLDEGASSADRMARRTADLEAAWKGLTGALDDESAFLSVQDAFDDVRDKGAAAWEASRKGADDADQKARDYQESINSAKRDVITLGQQIGLSIPETKKLLLQIDDHQIDDVERQLDIMSRNRTMNLSIIANGGQGYSPRNPSNPSQPSSLAPSSPAGFAALALPGADVDPAGRSAGVPELAFPITVMAAPTAGPSHLTLDMRGAILGSRYDVVRTIRVAVRDGVRLAGARNVLR